MPETLFLVHTMPNGKKVPAYKQSHTVHPDTKGVSGDIPLCQAVRAGHVKIVALLLQYGANPDLQDNDGNTALHYAILNSCVAMLKSLRDDNFAIARQLLSYNANPLIENKSGISPLALVTKYCETSDNYKIIFEQMNSGRK